MGQKHPHSHRGGLATVGDWGSESIDFHSPRYGCFWQAKREGYSPASNVSQLELYEEVRMIKSPIKDIW